MLQPRLDAIKAAYLQICNLLADQYGSGSFEAMELSGWGNNRQWFSEEIDADMIEGVGSPEVEMVGNLPQDEMTKMSMAQMAREGAVPLLPDLVIRDEILGLQNSDQVESQIKEQMAERTLPEASLWTLLKATEDRGRPDLSQFYFSQLGEVLMQKQLVQQQLMQQMQQMQQVPGMQPGMAAPGMQPGAPNGAGPMPGAPMPGGPMPPGPMPGGPMPGGPTAPPQAMPNAGMGVPPPVPTPQAGANVPPGSPRPGAQSDQERLARIGLFGPGG